MPEPSLPTYREFLFPTLRVLEDNAGSLSKREVDAAVIELLGITDEQLAVAYPADATARGSKVLHRIAFARSSLKLCGATDNSTRGVWSITPRGRELLSAGTDEVIRADSAMRKQLARNRAERGTDAPGIAEPDEVLVEQPTEETWRSDLLEELRSMPPSAFERLCAQLLREAGCEEVEVTRASGDEGLDGVGILRVGLLSFPVYFQAKRYSGSVGPEKVRELRGALQGRADKGIFITTGRFTRAAADEAGRAGAPIDLVDGDRLCDLLLQYEIGVRARPVVDAEALERFGD